MQENVLVNVKETLEAFKNLTTTVVLIKNISISKKDKLEEKFSKFGKLYFPSEESKNYAYLECNKLEDAERAIMEFNEAQIDGSVIEVEILEPPTSSLINRYSKDNKNDNKSYNSRKRSRSREKYDNFRNKYNKRDNRNYYRRSNSRDNYSRNN